jgi:ubiquinol-cytochrome c reductase cytochrome b subunit
MAGVLGLLAIGAAFVGTKNAGKLVKMVAMVVAVGTALLLGLLPFLASMLGATAMHAVDAIAGLLASVPVLGQLWVMVIKGLDAKFWGVVVMGASTIILFFLPWLDYSQVKSIRYRPDWHKYLYGIFVVNFLILGYLGVQPVGVWGEIKGQDIAQRISQLGTLFYFGFFLLMPWWSKMGEFKQVPDRVVFAAH